MLKYIYIIVLFFSLIGNNWAQPANDECPGATALPTNGTCLTGETTTGAGDHWQNSVGCASNNVNEVWYSFTATGTQADITVTQGTMTGNIEVIIVSATSPCTGLALAASNCGAGPSTLTSVQNLVVGDLYYVTVNGTGTDGTFDICNNNFNPPPTPGQDCPSAFSLCNQSSFSVGTVASGAGTINGAGSNEAISTNSCFGGNERQSQWYTFSVDEAGDLEFQIDPNTFSDDYDWAVYDITSTGCAVSGSAPIACNWSGCPGMTGLTSSIGTYTGCLNATCDYFFGNPSGQGSCDGPVGGPDNGNGASQWENQVNLVAGNTYAILVDNFSTSNNGFNFTWTGTDAEIGPDATFTTSLDPSCTTVTLDRLTNYAGPNMTYLWTFGDGTTSTNAVPAPYTYSSTGQFTISLEVTDASGCTSTFSTNVDIGCVLLASKLTAFDGSYSNKNNVLSWNIENNKDIDYFVLQRSTDGISWSDVQVISANSEVSNTYYSYNDDEYTLDKNNYYRLQLHPVSGTVSFSKIVVIQNRNQIYGGLHIHRFYPSPVNEKLTVEVESNNNQMITLNVYNMLGYPVIQQTFAIEQNINTLMLDTEFLPNGIYTLQLEDKESTVTQTRKFIKK